MSIKLKEFQVYKLRVGLPIRKFGEKASTFETKYGMTVAGSYVWLDQISDGCAVFHLFGEDLINLYVEIPIIWTNDCLEMVLDKHGNPEIVKEIE